MKEEPTDEQKVAWINEVYEKIASGEIKIPLPDWDEDDY